MFVSAFSAQPFMGKLRILALNEPVRYARLPNVPTVAEFVPGFEKRPTWYAFFGPAGMPRSIVLRLNGEMNRALAAPEMKEYLDTNAFISFGGSPEDLAAALRKGVEVYGVAVKVSGLKPE